MEGGVRAEGEVGASRDGRVPGIEGSDGATNDADELQRVLCDIGEVRAEARAAAAAVTADGLRGTQEGLSGGPEVGLVRMEEGRLQGAKVEAEAVAGGLTLEVLVFPRINLPPRTR